MADEATKAVKMKTHVDHAGGVVVITRGDVATRYDLNALPDSSMNWLAGRGLAVFLARTDAPDKQWAALMNGSMSSRDPAKPKEPSVLAKAISMALRDELATARDVKKADKVAHQALLDEATAMVSSMSREARMTARASSAVLAYIAQLKGKASTQPSLLSMTLPKPPAPPAGDMAA